MKYLITALIILFSSLSLKAQIDLRSDSFDIIATHINLDLSDIGSKAFVAHTNQSVLLKKNIATTLDFDLLLLTIDSIKINNIHSAYQYNDTVISLDMNGFNKDDTLSIDFYYQGTPKVDNSGFGGFYFIQDFAFNIGVAFEGKPHNYGRVWYPCFDNFIEKGTYSFAITTDTLNRAFCTGIQDSVKQINDRKTWYWSTKNVLPSYLVSVAVSKYAPIEYDYNGLQDTFPVQLVAKAADTAKMRASFKNLNQCIHTFETKYGPHPYERVGYVAVPFNGGAMEHATNIAYPYFAVNGNLNNERLLAHELAHHWWGDIVTCSTAEDMWLNEGWASYSEHIFLEGVYGPLEYKNSVRTLHEKVLHQSHIRDDGYLAIYGIGHDKTYGSHVYNKGADVAHTLRAYMENDFFDCLESFILTNKNGNMNSYMFRDYLSNCSNRDLTAFFDNWVFNSGFPHFSIDSFKNKANNGKTEVTVYIRQRKSHAPNYYSNVPLIITYMDDNFNRIDKKVYFSGRCGYYTTSLNFNPTYVSLDFDEKISDAISDESIVINNTGLYDFVESRMKVTVNSLIVDSALLRIEHNWIPPDRLKKNIPGLILSDYRYWKVDGIFDEAWDVTAKIDYNGSTSLTNGNLDNNLISNSEDSLILMFRPSPKEDWKEYSDYSLNVMLSKTNKIGFMEINKLRKGEYCMAIWDHSRTDSIISDIPTTCKLVGLHEVEDKVKPRSVQVYPNPATDYVSFRIKPSLDSVSIVIFDNSGKKLKTIIIPPGDFLKTINTGEWASGLYLINYQFGSNPSQATKLIIGN